MGPIGNFSVGKIMRTGVRRKNIIAKTKKKMQMWRDRARSSLIQNSIRYARKVNLNKRLMVMKKAGRPKNLNPSAFSSQPEKRGDRLGCKFSTIPARPRYSDIQPKKRLYGMRLKSATSNRNEGKAL
ncbi:MAG: hypothetical protein HY051_00285 [Candidatus Aenigmarchaeota archaeon]|nr:hypothetical protein [Candidatus Aenigmarchaeota archaeon]